MEQQSKSLSFEDELDWLRENAVLESPTRYVFNSINQEGVAHVVDLLVNNLNGECTCQHYQYRIKAMIKQGLIKPKSEKARCKHIRVARQMLYDEIITKYVEINGIGEEELQ